MPVPLQYISFVIGVISLVLTLLTFINTCRVNRKITQTREREQFHKNRNDISGELDGYIRSITTDQLHKNDKNNTLSNDISMMLTNLATKYTIFSRRTRKCIRDSKKCVGSYNIDWNTMVNLLIALKNYIDKEI